jgi:hypothetical protein
MGDTFDRFTPPDRGRFGDNESAPDPKPRGPKITGSSDLKDLELVLHHQTQSAVLVSTGSIGTKPVWIPKSQCEFVATGRYPQIWNDGRRKIAPEVLLRLPEWLGRDKGLI